ncbi:MAG: aminotransferase class III-fold pyridoxal phosphate-dependent enzyme [Spirochaetales bacterium]|nr:aminotransferase class III-fold pyridoxal phosphate-dependent enzyme [Spirochaetales bacterium]
MHTTYTHPLYHHIPVIKRARGYRLYDKNGNRIIDLYQNNGHALLGHRASRLTSVLKNIISKGLIFDVPSIYTYRLKKAVKQLVPGTGTVCLAGSLDHGLKIISDALKVRATVDDIVDPLWGKKKGRITVWRPFTRDDPDSVPVIIPVLPFSIAGAPVIICLKKEYKNPPEHTTMISPFILAGSVRAVYDLGYYRKPDWLKDDILKGAKKWEQKGIYIIARMKEEEYQSAFKDFLKAGVLLSPHYPGPSIFPAELSHGELQKILHLFHGAGFSRE